MPESNRDLILQQLKNNRLITVMELSRLLGITKPDVLYHLKLLMKQGLVERNTCFTKRAKQRGRPEFVYSLTDNNYPNNYTKFSIFLWELTWQNSGENHEIMLDKLSKCILGTVPELRSLTQRLHFCIQRLTQHAYLPYWEAHREGPVIIFRNCPYRTLRSFHPEICEFDTKLIEIALGTPVKQTTAIMDEKFHSPSCTFVVST